MANNVTDSNEMMLLCGKRLKECREYARYTQEQLIEKIEQLPENGNKTRNEKHLSAIESGKRKLSLEYAHLISRVLLVRKEYLLGYDNFKTGSDETLYKLNEYQTKDTCIKYLISKLGYTECYSSDISYQKLYISSEDNNQDIEKKIKFAQKRLKTFPEYDMTLSDSSGRKIHLTSKEFDRIYDDIEFFIKYRIEREFEDITRYVHSDDMKHLTD